MSLRDQVFEMFISTGNGDIDNDVASRPGFYSSFPNVIFTHLVIQLSSGH